MKPLYPLAAYLFLSVSISAAGLLGSLTKKEADWDFIQRTGGIKLENVEQGDGVHLLYLKYDPTGLTEVTRKPEIINSGIVVHSIQALRRGERIEIKVFLSVPTKESRGNSIHKIELPKLDSGTYDLFYGNRKEAPQQKIGSITID